MKNSTSNEILLSAKIFIVFGESFIKGLFLKSSYASVNVVNPSYNLLNSPIL